MELRLPLTEPPLTTLVTRTVPLATFLGHKVVRALRVLAGAAHSIAVTRCGELFDDGREDACWVRPLLKLLEPGL